MWAGTTAPAHGHPAARPFLPSPMASAPPFWHPVTPKNMSPDCPIIPEPTSLVATGCEPPPVAAEPAQPAAPPAHAAPRPASPRPASPRPAPASVSATRLPASVTIITPPHPEGLAQLQQRRELDSAAKAAEDKPRGPSVVTPMPTAEQIARLRTAMGQRRAVKQSELADMESAPCAGRQKAFVSPVPVRALSSCSIHGVICLLFGNPIML